MDVSVGLAAAGNALSIAKALRDVEKSYDASTYKRQVVDLIDALTDAKLALAEARDLLATREAEIAALKAANDLRGNLVKGDGGYSFLTNEAGERYGFPICPKCYSKNGKIVIMVQNFHVDAGKCPVCDAEYRPVTCYVPASENNGTETTKVGQYLVQQKQKRDRETAAMNRLNESSWMSR